MPARSCFWQQYTAAARLQACGDKMRGDAFRGISASTANVAMYEHGRSLFPWYEVSYWSRAGRAGGTESLSIPPGRACPALHNSCPNQAGWRESHVLARAAHLHRSIVWSQRRTGYRTHG